ncbi:MAG TPA: DinB family protein [Gemmatimonadaceae bacterium]|nr:DinB family protein [Gemmatimonadaceae bacterium]
MHSLWNEVDRRNLLARIDKLAPNMRPVWGRMSAAQTVAHLADWFRMAIGAIRVESKNTPLRFTPLKQLVIYVLPFPKNVPTAPELLKSEPGVWTEDTRDLKDLLRRTVQKQTDKNAKWPDHPAFGAITGEAWGVLGYRHTDHHLKQFGV